VPRRVHLEDIGELTDRGEFWQLTYSACGHVQEYPRHGIAEIHQAASEVRLHYARCLTCALAEADPPQQPPGPSSPAVWIILRVQRGRESLALQSLADRGIQTSVPLLSRPGRPGRQPLLPGYLFARVRRGTDDLLRLRSAPGVKYVFPQGGRPADVPEHVVQRLRQWSATPPAIPRPAAAPVRPPGSGNVDAFMNRRLTTAKRLKMLLALGEVDVPPRLSVED
jgi:transcription antitermination factor NusG